MGLLVEHVSQSWLIHFLKSCISTSFLWFIFWDSAFLWKPPFWSINLGISYIPYPFYTDLHLTVKEHLTLLKCANITFIKFLLTLFPAMAKASSHLLNWLLVWRRLSTQSFNLIRLALQINFFCIKTQIHNYVFKCQNILNLVSK